MRSPAYLPASSSSVPVFYPQPKEERESAQPAFVGVWTGNNSIWSTPPVPEPPAANPLDGLLDLNTVSLLELSRLKPRQQEVLLKHNCCCLFCHRPAPPSAHVISDKKNGKNFLVHK